MVEDEEEKSELLNKLALVYSDMGEEMKALKLLN